MAFNYSFLAIFLTTEFIETYATTNFLCNIISYSQNVCIGYLFFLKCEPEIPGALGIYLTGIFS